MTIVTAAPVSFGMPRSLLTLELFRTRLVSRKDRTMRRSERSVSPKVRRRASAVSNHEATDVFASCVRPRCRDLRAAISGQEFYAVGLAPAPDHFARLARRMFGHQRQIKDVPDVQRGVGHDLGAAR